MVLTAESLKGTALPEGQPDGESRTDGEGKAYYHTFTKEEINEKYGKPEVEEESEKAEDKIEEEKPKKKKGKKK